MNLFITAGNTQTPVDQVRCITNVFTGRTGARIAQAAHERGHRVTIATSHPETVHDVSRTKLGSDADFVVLPYRTFEDLESIMAAEIRSGRYQAVIHAAAVNDYHVAGAYSPGPQVTFDSQQLTMTAEPPPVRWQPATGAKIKGNHAELWLRMVPAPKLVDKIRTDWQFTGTLVKFKLEVNVSDAELLAIGEASRVHSRANWLVANTLEGRNDWAYLLGDHRPPVKIIRDQLASQLLSAIGC
ncbi:MAG: phosphopantothenoylcysteine decarboxylase [Gemmataceae bacterium]